MHAGLAETLVTKGIIVRGTEVEAKYLAKGLGCKENIVAQGDFMIVQAFRNEDGKIGFEMKSTKDGTSRKVLADAIVTIDGMEPERFAAVYNVKPDGGTKAAGKRRGRKPKNRGENNGGSDQSERLTSWEVAEAA